MANPLSYEDWLAQQGNAYQGDDTGGTAPGIAYRSYMIPFQNQAFTDPSQLPQGFLQSDYGGPYQHVLSDYMGSYDRTEDPSGYGSWLRNAPVQYSAGRSLADWGKPTTSADYNLTNAGIQGTAAALTGGLSGPALNAVSRISPDNPATRYTGGPATIGGGNMRFLPGGGGTAEPAQQGGLFDNLLGTVGNLSPAILAGYLGNRQHQDVMGQVGRLNDVAGSLSGPAFMQSITNPYDLQTGQGRTALSQSLQQRGVGGSSFGNQQLGNFDYQRGLGRGDLAARAGTAVAGTQGQLYSDALRGMVGGNAAYNSLLGAGLGASGSLFNRPGAGGAGLGGSLSGIGSSLRNLFGGGIPTLPGAPPNFSGPGVDQFGNPTGGSNFSGGDPSQYGDSGGNWDPNTGLPSSSGNGLFDWLGQNGGDYGLNF